MFPIFSLCEPGGTPVSGIYLFPEEWHFCGLAPVMRLIQRRQVTELGSGGILDFEESCGMDLFFLAWCWERVELESLITTWSLG